MIAHQIIKAQHSRELQTVKRSALLPTGDDLAGTFMQELRTAVASRNPVAGRFQRPAGGQQPFEQRLRRYLAAVSDEEFIAFSKDTLGLLSARMQSEPLSTGGYIVFAEYEHGGEQVLLVAMLSTKAQPSFDAQLNLVASLTLDFEHLRYAGRVRPSSLTNNEDGVVHFVSRRADEVSDYFKEFLGCEAATDSANQGRFLFTTLRAYADGQNLSAEGRQNLMQRTYSYWRECRTTGRPMAMTTLAAILNPEDPRKVLGHFEQASGLAGEFAAPPPNIMKQFRKFAFDQSGLKLEFDRTDWLDKVSTRNGSVTIRQAPAELIALIEQEHGGS
ncbi:MAG: nucleoid-associated protein [Nibricoccus sp.]